MISIHRFRQGELFFAIDGGSASIHQLDRVAYDLLGLWTELAQDNNNKNGDSSFIRDLPSSWGVWDGEPEESLAYPWWRAHRPLLATYGVDIVREAGEELIELMNMDQLFHDDAYLEDLVGEELRPRSLKALCLNVSHDCNLRCRYCFAGTGAFGGERLNMPTATALRAIDFLLENSGGRERVEVDFFGGEPLLNLPVVKETVKYGEQRAAAQGKEIRFTLTTNGLLLDEETADYLNDKMFNLVLSLDGRPAINDRMRVAKDGSSVYDVIVPRIRRMAELRGPRQYYVRGTYTAHNKDFFLDVRHLVETGFHRVSVEPVVAERDMPYALRPQDLPELLQEYERLADYYCEMYLAGKPFEFYHFNLSLLQGQCLSKRLTGCGAGTEYLAITPNGDIYPCHQFVGREGYRMGSLSNTSLDERIQKTFRASNVLSKAECRRCWARFFCSGGCHANAVSINGDISQPDGLGCQLMKKRLECSIYIHARLMR